jgi:chromosome segregation ATPase
LGDEVLGYFATILSETSGPGP